MFKLFKSTFTLLVIIMTSSLIADDIDLISSEQTAYNANILLVMDVSGSMDFSLNNSSNAANTASDPSRITILKNALKVVLNDPELKNINVGLSSFSGDTSISGWDQTAHGISYPVSPIDGIAETYLDQNPLFDHPGISSLPPTTSLDQTTRSYLQTISDTWTPHGGTPIVDALFESALYFRGLPTNWGRHDPSKIRAAHPSTYVGLLEDTLTTTTETQCNALPCSGDSCNATATCSTTTNVETCSTPTCGDVCSAATTVREECGDGITSCGSGLNCEEGVQVEKDRVCLSNDPQLCIDSAASEGIELFNCQSESLTECGIVFGVNICYEIQYQVCKEKVEATFCDADSFECTKVSESCQHEVCSDVITNTTVLTGDAVFVSPIKEECPANGIILLSDGEPTVNRSADIASDMMGSTNSNNCDIGDDKGRCGVELASYLSNSDNNTAVLGNQMVNTFTLGMSLQSNVGAEVYLKSLAKAGGGEFINASTPEELVAAFKLAIDGIVATRARSFTAPTYSIDTSSLLSHDGSVYVPVFDRKGVLWPGNLKKYTIENGVIKDHIGNTATDSDGSLLASARDLWSTTESTDAVRSGGVAHKLNPNSRIIKTDNGSNIIELNSSLPSSVFENGNGLTFDNNEIQKLVTFIKGTNPDTDEVRNHMGDIIHSKPIKLVRNDGSATIFVGTNEGYLHAINDADGTEAYAYMPSDLLKNIYNQYHQNINATGHSYGVDGIITLWIDERNSPIDKRGNRILDVDERAYIFFGLRRGGKKFYALDVTDASNPSLVWQKTFGSGDSWSQPVVNMLKWHKNQDDPAPVLVVGGGYNDGNDNGDGVYVVSAFDDPQTGAKAGDIIWSTKVAEANSSLAAHSIQNGVPSRIRTIDLDRNGSIDRLYFGDTGGNVWRVDLNAGDYSENDADKGDVNKAKLYKLATLGGTGAANRKFFEEPDIAIFRQLGTVVATVAIGSGDRTNPLESTEENKFFVLYDKELSVEPEQPIITLDMLKEANSVIAADIGSSDFRGWKRSLTRSIGEKVLAPAITFQNKVMFTTFGSVPVELDACNPTKATSARMYIIDLISGVTYTNVEVASGEILGTPQIYFKSLTDNAGTGSCESGDCTRKAVVRVGKVGPFELPDVGSFQEASDYKPTIIPRVYWIDNEKQY